MITIKLCLQWEKVKRSGLGKEYQYQLHLKLSDSSTWQEAWCSNWSSSHRKQSQKEHLNILPPWSQTPRSHSWQTASIRGQVQAWAVRHRLPWQTHASQWSQIAPWESTSRVITESFWAKRDWNDTYHHTEACGEYSCVSNDTVSGLQHAFDLAAVGAYRESLNALTEVTEGSTLLLSIALVALLECSNKSKTLSRVYDLFIIPLLHCKEIWQGLFDLWPSWSPSVSIFVSPPSSSAPSSSSALLIRLPNTCIILKRNK